LEQRQIADVFNWQQFFDKTYTFAGLLNGRFYDENGQPKESLKNAEKFYGQAQEVRSKNLKI
jgi:hypothetical protein